MNGALPRRQKPKGPAVTPGLSAFGTTSVHLLSWRSRWLLCALRLDARGERNAHVVEAAVHEEQHDDAEDARERVSRAFRQAFGEFDREQAEEGRELDDGVHGNRAGVLEGV